MYPKRKKLWRLWRAKPRAPHQLLITISCCWVYDKSWKSFWNTLFWGLLILEEESIMYLPQNSQIIFFSLFSCSCLFYFGFSLDSENWKHFVATVCESFQSGNQTWRMEDSLLWTSFPGFKNSPNEQTLCLRCCFILE